MAVRERTVSGLGGHTLDVKTAVVSCISPRYNVVDVEKEWVFKALRGCLQVLR